MSELPVREPFVADDLEVGGPRLCGEFPVRQARRYGEVSAAVGRRSASASHRRSARAWLSPEVRQRHIHVPLGDVDDRGS